MQLYKIVNDLSPEYLKPPILSLRRHLYGIRRDNVLKDITCKTVKYRNSFFPDSVSMWNDLGPEMRGAESISVFKRQLLKLYRPEKKTLYNIHDDGIKWIFQLRVGLSPLKSHKKSHHFLDTPYDTCNCSRRAETTCHFLLYCPNFTIHRKILFGIVNPILRVNDIPFPVNCNHYFIRNTSRFSQTCFTNAQISSYPKTVHFITFVV